MGKDWAGNAKKEALLFSSFFTWLQAAKSFHSEYGRKGNTIFSFSQARQANYGALVGKRTERG